MGVIKADTESLDPQPYTLRPYTISPKPCLHGCLVSRPDPDSLDYAALFSGALGPWTGRKEAMEEEGLGC